jgi:PhnB protein
MSHHVKAQPDGYHTVNATLTVNDGAHAITFYEKAFGAKLRMRMPTPDGKKVLHAELQLGDTVFMLVDEDPTMTTKSPKTAGTSTASLLIYTPDTDALVKQATAAGATVVMPPVDMFWGDRFARVRDPFGHEWGIATHQEDVTPEEMAKRSAKFAAERGGHP